MGSGVAGLDAGGTAIGGPQWPAHGLFSAVRSVACCSRPINAVHIYKGCSQCVCGARAAGGSVLRVQVNCGLAELCIPLLPRACASACYLGVEC